MSVCQRWIVMVQPLQKNGWLIYSEVQTRSIELLKDKHWQQWFIKTTSLCLRCFWSIKWALSAGRKFQSGDRWAGGSSIRHAPKVLFERMARTPQAWSTIDPHRLPYSDNGTSQGKLNYVRLWRNCKAGQNVVFGSAKQISSAPILEFLNSRDLKLAEPKSCKFILKRLNRSKYGSWAISKSFQRNV